MSESLKMFIQRDWINDVLECPYQNFGVLIKALALPTIIRSNSKVFRAGRAI